MTFPSLDSNNRTLSPLSPLSNGLFPTTIHSSQAFIQAAWQTLVLSQANPLICRRQSKHMKKLYLLTKWILSVALLFSFVSCATGTSEVSNTSNPRFQDESQVDVVLRFSSWDWTFLVRPEYSEDGFLGRVRPDNINQVFKQLKVPHGTAAVLVGWTYNGDTLDKLVADWKAILGRCGFQRVIVLRARDDNRLNGSIIIDDSILHVSSVQGPSQGG
jgi:hypothetical protein